MLAEGSFSLTRQDTIVKTVSSSWEGSSELSPVTCQDLPRVTPHSCAPGPLTGYQVGGFLGVSWAVSNLGGGAISLALWFPSAAGSCVFEGTRCACVVMGTSVLFKIPGSPPGKEGRGSRQMKGQSAGQN